MIPSYTLPDGINAIMIGLSYRRSFKTVEFALLRGEVPLEESEVRVSHEEVMSCDGQPLRLERYLVEGGWNVAISLGTIIEASPGLTHLIGQRFGAHWNSWNGSLYEYMAVGPQACLLTNQQMLDMQDFLRSCIEHYT